MYSWIAILCFALVIFGGIVKVSILAVIGMGLVMFYVPFNMNDKLKRE
ncbi:hypothetical protein [Psychrobacillus sp. FSL H8-0510]